MGEDEHFISYFELILAIGLFVLAVGMMVSQTQLFNHVLTYKKNEITDSRLYETNKIHNQYIVSGGELIACMEMGREYPIEIDGLRIAVDDEVDISSCITMDASYIKNYQYDETGITLIEYKRE